MRFINRTRCSWLSVIIISSVALSWLYLTHSKQDVFPEIHNSVSREKCPCASGARMSTDNEPNLAYNKPNESQALTVVKQCGSRYGKAVLKDDITVVYNRVPKCGSRALLQCVKSLVKKNQIRGPIPMVPPTFKAELALLTRTVEGIRSQRRAFLEGHVRFNHFQDERVHYINMIRDPLNRLVSSFYFNRHGDGLLSPRQLADVRNRTKPEVIDETFDECVSHERLSCTGPQVLSYVIGFFCGFHPRCRKATQWTLDEAKRNLDYYTAVGIVEEYNSSMRVLEFLFPSMFTGLVKRYTRLSRDTDFQVKAHAHRYVPPSPKVKAYMTKKLKLEYEFYEYAKSRFDMLLDELHLRDSDVR
ncbi:uronyl 2-sulfotransferase-like isoform X2 [Strongylocentrotus purpuratus]|uniref:Uncharacterized protein n=1 Tax=Strongylocentrotus purpuratus TaxID=7668 RepID=A0A7M7PJ77_STRPU|nr:uronyl 2-sulfotransferase-like isoform X1 [Strongylocentrotus purpuratus]XP_030851069.1 uronyl 2-sulfotransferase-like isoform X2 [Strongylocentrotus purpuratus]